MITKEHKLDKYCCLYVSEFHLEMILLPYIKNNINSANIIIKTQINLLESVRKVLERINLTIEEKEKILKLNWDCTNMNQITIDNKEKNIIIINGNKEYVSEINKELDKINDIKLNIVECYNISQIDIKKININKEYKGILNTNYIKK